MFCTLWPLTVQNVLPPVREIDDEVLEAVVSEASKFFVVVNGQPLKEQNKLVFPLFKIPH